jgi:hypothetical protein
MLRAWLLTISILTRIGLLKLERQEQFEKLDHHHCNQNKDQPCNCSQDKVD